MMLGFSLVIYSSIVASLIIMTIAAEQQQPSRAQVKQNLSRPMLQEFVVPSGSQPHDVA
jgi:hypothetical protein